MALTALRFKDHKDGTRYARDARKAAEAEGDQVGVIVARAVELRIVATKADVEPRGTAADRLSELAHLVPAVDAAALVFVRRLLVETLYLADADRQADRLALAVFRDAKAIDSARDADAVLSLLKLHKRHEVLHTLKEHARLPKHDQIDDWQLIADAARPLGRKVR
jgi:hypothetical protein